MRDTTRRGPSRAPTAAAAAVPRRLPAWLLAIAGLALAVRLGVVLQLDGSLVTQRLVGDGRAYDAWARRIAAGEWVGRDPFFFSPLYAYLLGALYWLAGPHWTLVRVLQAGLGALACVLLADATARLFDRRAGIAAGLIAALYAPLVWADVSVHKTAVEVCLSAGFVALFVRLLERRTPSLLAGCGALLACLALSRENAVVLLPIACLWLLLRDRREPAGRRWREAGLLALGFAVGMSPVLLRNRLVTGEWATTYNFGSSFYIGNHRDAEGLYDTIVPGHGRVEDEAVDVIHIAEADLQRTLRPSEVSRYWFARARADVVADPLRWLALLGRKWMLVWNSAEPMDTEAFEVYADASWLLALLGHVVRFGTVVPLAVLGLWLSRREVRRLWVLHAAIVTLALSITLFFVLARYRLSLMVFLLPFAGLGAAALVVACRERRWSLGAAGALLPVAAAALIHWPLATSSGDPRAATYGSYGEAYLADGQPEQGLALLRQAVAIEPGDAVIRNDLAVAMKQTGDMDGALVEFREAVRLQPGYADAQFNLSCALSRRGDLAGALAACREALRFRPVFPLAQSHLGYLLFRSGDAPGAIAAWREAVRLDPEDVTSWANLAALLAGVGDVGGAIAAWREVLHLQPDRPGARESLDKLMAERAAR